MVKFKHLQSKHRSRKSKKYSKSQASKLRSRKSRSRKTRSRTSRSRTSRSRKTRKVHTTTKDSHSPTTTKALQRASMHRDVSYVTTARQSPYVENDGREVHKTIYETEMICDGDVVGSFTIESNFDNSFLTMGINIDEDFQGQGHARGLIKTMCAYIKTLNIIEGDQLLYIDTDASDEFWGHIGMTENANFESEDSTIIGSGYEYEIEFGKLHAWANKK